MGDKALISSKTAWINTIYSALSPAIVSGLVALGLDAESAAATAVAVLGIINLVMRKISSGAITGIVKAA